MKRANRPSSRSNLRISVLVGGLLIAAGAAAQDWPQWLGPERNGHVAAFTPPAAWPGKLNRVWKVPVGNADATPALVGDRLYVFARDGDNEVLRCLEAATGQEIWQNAYAAEPATGPASRHPGPRASVAYADGKLVTYGVRGVLSCVNAADGKVLWRKNDFPDAWPTFFTSASPLILDGKVIALVGGQRQGGVAAYDLASGSRLWLWDEDVPAYASPVVAEIGGRKVVLALTERQFTALDPTKGTVLWQTEFPSGRRAYNAATPIVDGNRVYLSGAGRGTRAYQLSWDGNQLQARQLWTNTEVAVQFNTPILAAGRLHGWSNRGNAFCLDAATGNTVWVDEAREANGFGTVVAAGDILVVMTPAPRLSILSSKADRWAPLAQYKVADGATYAMPVLAGHRIWIQDNSSLTLWKTQ